MRCGFLKLVSAARLTCSTPLVEDCESMGRRIADFFRSDLGVLLLIAAARFVLYVATNGQYGFHRDELQTLDDARHLDGPALGLPPAMSLPNSFSYRGNTPPH